MSNETLALLVKAGETERIPVLWEQTFRLMYKKAAEYFVSHRERCAAVGIEVDDLRQECYFGLLDAVKAFPPDSAYQFITYLNYPLLSLFNALAGLRTRRQLHESATPVISLETPTGDGLTIGDTLPCPAAAAALDQAEARIYNGQLHDALDTCLATLPEISREAIHLHFYDGLTCQECGEVLGLPPSKARQRMDTGLHKMRHGKCRRILEPYKLESLAYRHRGLKLFRSTFTSVTEYAAIKLLNESN